MSTFIDLDETNSTLADVLAAVDAGGDVVLSRAGQPVARVTRIEPRPAADDVAQVIEEIKAARAGYKPVTIDEIIAWKNEGRR